MPQHADALSFSSGGMAREMPIVPGEGTQGALIHDEDAPNDRVAVVYDSGEQPPKITVTEVSDCVQAVHANGVAVAVVACAAGPRLKADDVVLVERFVPQARTA